jgi:hypothetical protein
MIERIKWAVKSLIDNPIDVLQTVYASIGRPCLMAAVVIIVLWILAAMFLNVKRRVLSRIALGLMVLSCVSITAFRVYEYIFPRMTTQGGKENYSAYFNDMQNLQIQAARKYGISPLKNRAEAEECIKSGELVKVTSSRNYHLAKMGYSVPYLTDNAAELLHKIGRNFRDSLESKGLCEHKILVTSMLRTDADVERLMKSNSVAVRNSAHRHATTFDISYRNFVRVGMFDNTVSGDLKRVLAEVLRDLRKERLCYVRYESSQSCFHITSRK